MSWFSDFQKIDSRPANGLTGVIGSIAYFLDTLTNHFHSVECWFGNDGDGSGSTANNLDVWQLTAGNSEAYGTEVQLLAANDINSGDFPITPVNFDLHRLLITAVDATSSIYMIQLWAGPTNFASASLLAEVPFHTEGEKLPVSVQMAPQSVNNKVWARVKCQEDGKTIDFIVGVHAYEG